MISALIFGARTQPCKKLYSRDIVISKSLVLSPHSNSQFCIVDKQHSVVIYNSMIVLNVKDKATAMIVENDCIWV